MPAGLPIQVMSTAYREDRHLYDLVWIEFDVDSLIIHLCDAPFIDLRPPPSLSPNTHALSILLASLVEFLDNRDRRETNSVPWSM